MNITSVLKRLGLVVSVTAMMGISVGAQETKVSEKDVPAAVVAAFKSAYPQATVRGYAREKEDGKLFYEVESMDGQTHRDILYNPDGTVAVVEEGIAIADLPAEALESMRTMYPGAVVTSAEKILRDGLTEYEAQARKGKRRIEVKFDAHGKILKKGA